MVDIVLSLKPQWWKRIANKVKTVEVRKTIPHAGLPFRAFVYETKSKGRGKIVGEFIVRRFWSNYKNIDGGNSMLTDEEISKYGKGKAYGWEISEAKIHPDPIELQCFGRDRPPQSWYYL